MNRAGTLFGPFGALLTKVIGTRPAREGEHLPSVICDAGIASVPLAEKFHFPVRGWGHPSTSMKVDLLGPSCMQRDRLALARDLPRLKRGDPLLLYGLGAYSIALAQSFIYDKPGMVGWWPDGTTKWIRKPESLDYHFSLQPSLETT